MTKKLNITHSLSDIEMFGTDFIKAQVNVNYSLNIGDAEISVTYQNCDGELEIGFQAGENEEILEIMNSESDVYDDDEMAQIQNYIKETLDDEADDDFQKFKKDYNDDELKALDIDIDKNYSFKSNKSEEGEICRNFLIKKLEEKIEEEIKKYNDIEFVSCNFSTYDDTIDLEIKGDFALGEIQQEVLDCAEIVHDKYQSGDYEEAILCIFEENGLPTTF